MFKNMTVGKKIILGFSSVLIILIVVGFIGYNALSKSSTGFMRYRQIARNTNLVGRLQANMLMMRLNVQDFISTGNENSLKEYEDYVKKMEGFIEDAQKEIKNVDRAAKIDRIDSAHADYKTAFQKVAELKKLRDRYVSDVLNVQGPQMEKSLTNIMNSAHDDHVMGAAYNSGLAMRNLLLARLYVVKFLETNDQKAVDRVHAELGTLQQQIDTLDREIVSVAQRKLINAVADAKNIYASTFDNLVKAIFERNAIIADTLDRIGPEIAKTVEDITLAYKNEQDDLGPKLVASNNLSIKLISIIAFASVLLGAFLAMIITRGITKAISRVVDGLSEGAGQVASASSQVSTASQSLAEGASEQAASIEETSSSLEEMSSMTRQNADNATQADTLMKEANQVVNSANTSMGDLTQSMEEISKASEETSKIIKTIDEIAFQTNLLALNAAVEAARAGEAGAGFAVVADEVRNLAMRAADAAKNTANLIEGTVKKVNAGGELVAKTNEAFAEVARSTAKVGELVGEIAAASSEQAQGITQVNTAVNEVDKVTQQNAASAEESASAAEEMNAQAVQMRSYVSELIAMVGGAGNAEQTRAKAGAATHKIKKIQQALHLPRKQADKRMPSPAAQDLAKARDPEKLIPLDNEDFQDF